MTLSAVILFWLSGFTLAYAWFLYPLLISLAARVRPRPVQRADFRGRISVLVAAHNEARNLPRKLRSLLEADAGRWIDQIVIGSDGSDDDTGAAVRSVSDPRVTLVEFAERRGKPAVLNDLIPRATGDVVVLTDARQELEPDALARLLRPFADPSVGVVSGELFFRNISGTAASASMDAYWRLEKMIRKAESRVSSVPGATGAFYAIRRQHLEPIPPDTLLDDVLIPMRVTGRGQRCLIEEGAIIWDEPSRDQRQESARKLRTMTGNVQLMLRYPRWWLPGFGFPWFIYFSHKVSRLLTPAALVGLAASNMLLFRHPYYCLSAFVQLSFYLMALVGSLASRSRWFGVAGKAYMFLLMAAVIARGWYRALSGNFDARWRRTTR